MKLKNFLVEVPVAEWSFLRDMYVDNWPNNYSTYFAIDNGIRLKLLDPGMYNTEIQIYSLNGDWSDGSFIMVLDKSSNSVLINTAAENLDRLKSAVELLDPNTDWCFYACVDKVKPVVRHYSKVYDFNYITPYPIIFHYLPKDKAVKLELPDREDVVLRQLCLDDAETINKIWPHRFPGSIRFVRRLISTDFSVGAFCKETGELMAWVLRLPIGGLGLLQVKEQYYRRGLGKLVTIAQSKQLAENGFDVSATVLHTNGPSRALFTNLGFAECGERSYMFKEGDGTPHH